MAKYVIEIPDDRIGDFVGNTNLLMPYTMAGHKGHHDTGLKLTPYTEPDEIKNNKVNLCDSCNYIYPECPSERHDVMFGDGVGKDNICCCSGYVAKNEDEIRQKAYEEAWEFMKIIINLDTPERISVFGFSDLWMITKKHSYREAKAKYESWRKKKDEIKIGDELINHIGKTYVIYDIDDHIAYGINLDKYPCTQECFSVRDDYSPKRTGRHFPEVAELLKKMREE